MIPQLEIDREAVSAAYKKEQKSIDYVVKNCSPYAIGSDEYPTYVHTCDDLWVKMGVYKKFKFIVEPLVDYGYCDSEGVLVKYLERFKKNPKNYFIHVYWIDMNDDVVDKSGSYINKYGTNTNGGYYEWIDSHPEDEGLQEVSNKFLGFVVTEISYKKP